MSLDPELCYRALATRDARFDGRFFTAVRSTGIYCRPVCPARTPKRENCVFLPCAAAAQEAGYRPCLRCRPEASPGTPAWLGTSATVSRALRLIEAGALDEGSVDALARRLGIGERHLRRLFLAHLGATPLSVASTRRLLFARRLLDETELPMTQVALASGFSSLRRFNAAFRETYRQPPSALRRRGRARRLRGAQPLTLRLAYRPPFDWSAVLAFLAPRATPGVEKVCDGVYSRTFRIDGVDGWLDVRAGRGHQLAVRLRLGGPLPLIGVVERLRRCFDLSADPAAIAAQLERDPLLAERLAARPGVRVPGAFDAFELAVRAILGQQVSVAAATRLAGRLVAVYGAPLSVATGDPELTHRFPQPGALVDARADRLGVPRARAAAIRALARAVEDGHLVLDAPADPEAALAGLRSLPGVGPWTADTIAMRALREPDAFPSGDLVLRKALGSARAPASPERCAARAEAWRPWRAYAAMLLWSAPV